MSPRGKNVIRGGSAAVLLQAPTFLTFSLSLGFWNYVPKENNNFYAISQPLCQQRKSWKVEAAAAKTPGETKQKQKKEKQEATRKNEIFFNLGRKNGIEAAAGITGPGTRRGRAGGGGDSATAAGGTAQPRGRPLRDPRPRPQPRKPGRARGEPAGGLALPSRRIPTERHFWKRQ